MATGITAVNIISGGTILALPLFAIPLFFGTIPLESTLRRVALLGLGMLAVAVAFSVLVLATDTPLALLGRAWWQALIAALGQRALEFAALLLTLYASGARVSPILATLAYRLVS